MGKNFRAEVPVSRKLFVLMNHALTEEQEKEARQSMGVKEILSPPGAVSKLWATVPPELDLGPHDLLHVFEWLEDAKEGDLVLVQGEFGATFIVVDWCLDRSLVPVYATSKREVLEERMPDGEVKRVARFKHVRFRRYKRANFSLENEK